MSKAVSRVFCFIIASCVCVHVFADAPTASDALWHKLRAITSMQASFTQHVYAKQRELSHSSGKMAFVRPAQFRWQTIEPMEQLLIADGKQLWMYDVLLEQVTVKQQTESMGAASSLFLSDNKTQFMHSFHVETAQEHVPAVFKLKARSKQANIQRMILYFKHEMLERMELYDQLGQRTEIRFKHAKLNAPVSAQLFQFSPPEGVDVVEQ